MRSLMQRAGFDPRFSAMVLVLIAIWIVLAFLTDGIGDTQIELTWLRDKEGPYELGDNESHIAFVVDDYDGAHAMHEQMGCICFENHAMGLYFIEDPDGYWLEILPSGR